MEPALLTARCSADMWKGVLHACENDVESVSFAGYGSSVSTNSLTLSDEEHVRCEANTFGSGSKRTPTPFLDFVVDGDPMRSRSRAAGYGDDFVTPFSAAWFPSAMATSLEALRNGTSGDEFADVLVCSYCGDRDCGALLVKVTVLDEVVTWSDWTWTNWEVVEPATGLEVFKFQRTGYQEVLDGAMAQLAALPYDGVRPQQRSSRRSWLPRRRRR